MARIPQLDGVNRSVVTTFDLVGASGKCPQPIIKMLDRKKFSAYYSGYIKSMQRSVNYAVSVKIVSDVIINTGIEPEYVKYDLCNEATTWLETKGLYYDFPVIAFHDFGLGIYLHMLRHRATIVFWADHIKVQLNKRVDSGWGRDMSDVRTLLIGSMVQLIVGRNDIVPKKLILDEVITNNLCKMLIDAVHSINEPCLINNLRKLPINGVHSINEIDLTNADPFIDIVSEYCKVNYKPNMLFNKLAYNTVRSFNHSQANILKYIIERLGGQCHIVRIDRNTDNTHDGIYNVDIDVEPIESVIPIESTKSKKCTIM